MNNITIQLNKMSCHKATIISEFETLLKIAKTSTESSAKWKIINYKKIIGILKGITDDITSTEVALTLFRREGMKFTTEKKLPYKSKILINIQEIIDQGFLSENRDNSQSEKIIALNTLMELPEIGPSKADKLYQMGIRNIQDLIDKPELINRKQHIGLRHFQDLKNRIPRSEMDQWKITLSDITQQVFNTIKKNTTHKNKLIWNL